MTADRLGDLERFSCAHGRFRYCSCMRWRMTSSEWRQSTTEDRVAALADLVRDGTPIGVLAYIEDEPVGWCSVAPRKTYRAVERSRAFRRIDDLAVWSVVCFFLDRRARHQGMTGQLLQEAIAYAASAGAPALEGYPVERDAHLYTYMGRRQTFERLGFADVTPPGGARPMMRLPLRAARLQ